MISLLTRTLGRKGMPPPSKAYSMYPGDINTHHFLSLVQARRDGAALAPPPPNPTPSCCVIPTVRAAAHTPPPFCGQLSKMNGQPKFTTN